MPNLTETAFHTRRANDHLQMANEARSIGIRDVHLELAAWHRSIVEAPAVDQGIAEDRSVSILPKKIPMWKTHRP